MRRDLSPLGSRHSGRHSASEAIASRGSVLPLHKGESSCIRQAMEINSMSVRRCLRMADRDIRGNVLNVGVAYKPDILTVENRLP